jgi:hypothetical protein
MPRSVAAKITECEATLAKLEAYFAAIEAAQQAQLAPMRQSPTLHIPARVVEMIKEMEINMPRIESGPATTRMNGA